LIHVGNDVVDLCAPQAQGKTLRHMRKILTNDEMQIVLESRHPHSLFWIYWAAKEAAYKAMRKSNSDMVFSPKRYSVLIDFDINHGSVITPKGSVPVRIEVNKDWVHCIAMTDDAGCFEMVKSGIEHIDQGSFQNERTLADVESRAVRWAVRKILAESLCVKTDEIDIVRTADHHGKLQPPIVTINGLSSDVDISLSHDGRFVAYCIINENCSELVNIDFFTQRDAPIRLL
jgi:phosphopantetheinyl transferase (holo-ACP synthase)